MDPISTTIFAGNAHPALARDIAYHLNLPMGRINVGRFSDGEINVEIMENVRSRDVFIVQPTCPPVNENLMELLIIADACQRASASRITAVIPYFGYGRQDRRRRAARVPITAKLVANLLAQSGIDRVLTVDVHADQIQGSSTSRWTTSTRRPCCSAMRGSRSIRTSSSYRRTSAASSAPERSRSASTTRGWPSSTNGGRNRTMAEVMNVIGEIAGKTCVLIDDMVDTAGTLCQAAGVLKQRGATQVVAYITHPVLSGPAVQRIQTSVLDEIVVTDTIPLSDAAKACPKIRQLSVAELLAETLRRINEAESVSSLSGLAAFLRVVGVSEPRPGSFPLPSRGPASKVRMRVTLPAALCYDARLLRGTPRERQSRIRTRRRGTPSARPYRRSPPAPRRQSPRRDVRRR